MPGQGYHLGFSRLVAERTGRKFTAEMTVGTLIVDAMNSAAGARRHSHFCGGAGCVLPYYANLKLTQQIQSWDSNREPSSLVDPQIDMRLMESASSHIPEGDYKDGVRLHLLADRAYDQLVQTQIFDISHQQDNIIRVRSTGETLDGTTFRKELYASYPMLDQFLLELAGVTEEDIEAIKELLRSTLNEAHAEFLNKYLNFRSDFVWKDTRFFNQETIRLLVERAVDVAVHYLTPTPQ